MAAPKMYMVAQICGAPSCWYHMHEKSRKETSSSKKSANGPDKISVYDSDVKGPLKYSGPIQEESGHILEHPQRVSASLKVWDETREYVYGNSQFYTSVAQHWQLYNKMDVFDWEV
ncbi:hypothetical protein TNCV_2031371 [Trichonephila clavipes]|nr:hypothetical protein TNCV_2031371 [Trichonephila clavipes]